MKTVILDGKKMQTVAGTHEYIAEKMGFPSYYGKNLDALEDCLGECGPNCAVIIINLSHIYVSLGGYAHRLLEVFRDVSQEEDSFKLIIQQ